MAGNGNNIFAPSLSSTKLGIGEPQPSCSSALNSRQFHTVMEISNHSSRLYHVTSDEGTSPMTSRRERLHPSASGVLAHHTTVSNAQLGGVRSRSRINASSSARHVWWFCAAATILLLTISHVLPSNANEETAHLPVCSRYQACAAEVAQFPLLSETVGHMEAEMVPDDATGAASDVDGSGSGIAPPHLTSAEEAAQNFPLYDEFVSRETLFDYQTEAELTRTHICRCPSGNEESEVNNAACDFDRTDAVMTVDRSLRLTFCQPVTDLFKIKCGGRRGLLRVIGQVDAKTGESIAGVNDTAVFCRCDSPAQLRRVAIEPWLDKYAFTYRCMLLP